MREEAKLLTKIEDAVREGLDKEGLSIRIKRKDRLKFLEDVKAS